MAGRLAGGGERGSFLFRIRVSNGNFGVWSASLVGLFRVGDGVLMSVGRMVCSGSDCTRNFPL